MNDINYKNLNQPYFENKNLIGKFCAQPWTEISIAGNGDVRSCTCGEWNSLPIGNILDTPIEEIYSSNENLKKLRNSVLDGSFGWCKDGHCSMVNNLPDASENPWVKFNIKPTQKLPRIIMLGIDMNCNLQCRSCRDRLIFNTNKNPTVTKILESLVNSYKDHDEDTLIFCDGAGDIFTSRSYDDILYGDMLPKCWKLTITTNGNLLSKRKQQLSSIRDNIWSIIVSLDSATPDVYKKIRGGDFNLLMAGLDILAELGIPTFLQFVLQRGNYEDLLAYKEIAKKYNAGYGIQKLDRRFHMSNDWWNYNTIDNNPDVNYVKLKDDLTELMSDPRCNADGGVQWLYRNI